VYYVGLDVHKEFFQASVLDEDGNEVSSTRVPTRREDLESFLAGFEEARFVLESTGVWEFVYGIIEAKGFDVLLAHPMRVKAISSAKVKTDKVDARTLAQLLRMDMIPASYVPDREVRDTRELVRHPKALGEKATAFKNRVKAELLRRGIRRPEELKTSWSDKSVQWMRSLGIAVVDSNLDVIEALQAQVKAVNDRLFPLYLESENAKLISTVPGIGYYGAMLIAAEIDDVHRFEDAQHLCSYAGLVPSVHQSSNVCYHGRISKQGSRHLRWILTEAVHIHVANEPNSQLTRFFLRVARRKGRQVATVATARKMLTAIYWMLMNEEEFKVTG
jgi:transposase